MNYCLGIDIGSTAVKACLIRTGDSPAVIGRGSADYPTFREGVIAEQKPEDWNRASAEAVRQAVSGLSPDEKKRISGICFSAQGGSVYAADADKKPLTAAYTWMDRRASAEAELFSSECGEENIRRACGWKPSAGDVASKIRWIAGNKPEIREKAAFYYTTEESVTGYMTGRFVTDATGEAITRLYDYRAGKYLDSALNFAGINASMLPEVAPCGSLAGYLLPGAADDMNLPAGIPVFVGAHDQYCASIGSGVTEPGQLIIATGTAWVIFGVSDKTVDAPPYPAPCTHPIPGRFGMMTSMAGCGGAIGAFAAQNGRTPRDLDDEIIATGKEEMRRRTRDLFVCPLPPEQSIPHKASVCRPLSADSVHGVADTALAAMEAVAFEARIITEAFEAAGFPRGDELVMSGGASKSPLWRSIVAAVMPEKQLFRLTEADAPALGAALLASVSAGLCASLREASSFFTGRIPIARDPEAAKYYAERFVAYRQFALE
ncbi:MAG: FGGY-family carbohydrate kinase [Clostridia bacterium]|nr:FGGY-family carbohydrate kinase [Clostridia bacterium]